MTEQYTPGYSSNAVNFMAARTIDSHAAFFKSYLKPGMHLLDCGCGPGTMTLGLAQLVAPGLVIGIDRAPSQVVLAQEQAEQQALQTVRFLHADVDALPFDDRSFDAVFAHAVLEHLQQPDRALQELWRVLKPGGVIGVRSPDWGGFLIAPSTPGLEDALSYYKALHQQNGGHPYIGRDLKALLRSAGFSIMCASATYQCYEPLNVITEYLALQIEASDGRSSRNQIKAADLAAMAQALRTWSQHPDGLFAQAWCEVVAQKPE